MRNRRKRWRGKRYVIDQLRQAALAEAAAAAAVENAAMIEARRDELGAAEQTENCLLMHDADRARIMALIADAADQPPPPRKKKQRATAASVKRKSSAI